MMGCIRFWVAEYLVGIGMLLALFVYVAALDALMRRRDRKRRRGE